MTQDQRTAAPRRVSRLPVVVVVVVLLGLVAAITLTRGSDFRDGCEALELPSFNDGVICEPGARLDAPVDQTFELVGDPDAEGSLGDLEGRYAVLNFWGAWCGPCRVEQPALNAASEVLDDVAFLGVAIQDSQVNQQAFRDEFDVPYPSLFDRPNRLAAAFGADAPRAPPTTFVLDREGRRAAAITGGLSTGDVIAAVEAVRALDAASAADAS